MSLARVEFKSEALGKYVTYNVILPEIGDGPFPVLLQLHGLSDDANGWIERSNLVRYAANYPLLVVLPDGGTSGYLNWPSRDNRLDKQNYEDLLVRDIPAHLARNFQIRLGPLAIGGLSMGGYGAMRLGLKYADQVASIWAHSSAFHIADTIPASAGIDLDDANVFWHADRVAKLAVKPIISFDCGTEDHLIDVNRQFHAHLEKIGLPHHYAEHPGGHTWDYWDLHVQEALAQHAKALGLATPDSSS